MPCVAALYRYPVKGFTPEECETLTVLDDGRITGDRVLGIRFADSAAADEAWSKKTEMVALMNTPGLARLHLTFEAEARRLRLSVVGTPCRRPRHAVCHVRPAGTGPHRVAHGHSDVPGDGHDVLTAGGRGRRWRRWKGDDRVHSGPPGRHGSWTVSP